MSWRQQPSVEVYSFIEHDYAGADMMMFSGIEDSMTRPVAVLNVSIDRV
jgi:hypothetical protein